MSHDAAIPTWREQGIGSRMPASWRAPIGQLALTWGALIVLATREWGEMIHQWWNIDTYNHILFVPPIVIWLVMLRMEGLARIQPRAWLPGVILIGAALSLWLVGRATEINLIAHAGAVAALQASVFAILGLRVGLYLLLPVGYMAFLVPFGDEIIPTLQMVTAEITIALTHFSGVPASIDGIHIYTPVGLFIVAEACSGVKFLIAMVALGVLVSFTSFERWYKRIMFLLGGVIVSILANGVRAWGTIYIAQSQGVEFAEGFDHIFYGWIFFAIIIVLVLGVAWKHFDREPEDAGLSLAEIDRYQWIKSADTSASRPALMLGLICALVLIFMFAAIYLPAWLL